MTNRVHIDGRDGEGGGQVLRTALALSLVTGRGFEIEDIRGRRHKPGLRRQHIVAVQAARDIGSARVVGDTLGSSFLSFEPGTVTHGDRTWSIGTAGSTALVFQTILWPLLVAPGRSRIVIEGGTHAPLAPTIDTLQDAFLPALAGFGVATAPLTSSSAPAVELTLERHGFMPAGGGRVVCTVHGGGALRPMSLLQRGVLRAVHARALVARLSRDVAKRELEVVQKHIPIEARMGGEALRLVEVDSVGPGNALQIVVHSEHMTEAFQAVGEKNVPAEAVAMWAVDEVHAYLASQAPVGPHLADQLLIPLALAGEGAFVTPAVTEHTRTNARLIERFCPVRFRIEAGSNGGAHIAVGRA